MNNFTFIVQKPSWNFLVLLSLFLLLMTTHYSSYANIAAGKTILAKGKVEAQHQASKEKRPLRRRSEIFDVDNIITGDKSKAQFSMSDGGLITLKENTEILISNYKFNPEAGEGSATLEIISGGLRSISGLIKKSGGDYQIKTPVGSIGIRGTHFAVEVIDDEVLFAVYSGNIDVELADQTTLSLGSSEDFSFASVNNQGVVTRMIQAPASISLGYSTTAPKKADESAKNENSKDDQASGVVVANTDAAPISTDALTYDGNELDDKGIYGESEWQGVKDLPIAELISERTGTLSYSNVSESIVNSSVGQVSDFTMSMTVDFDNASVPGGTLSFSDSEGEWFAAYSGLINIDQLELGINFASHGDNRADGSIFAAFSNGLDELVGGFSLQEINNPSVNADGSFKIQP
ncbi:FecR domain-containing protein [Cognaticolwellia aestuarii]|uniref:FecR family protein n=1 Tax=Cognaticolwellia aestuarii TaxID=329993 RepID=UPI000987A4A9|nr:FecR family protein [Cognaticolwellia aestuarii]